MKTKNTLNKNKIAILSAALNAAGDGWYQLLPAGEFKARDGRPFDVERGCWFLDENIATAFIQRTIDESKGKPILIDYDHQTLYKNENGQKAPAAGRIVNPSQDIQWRHDGIYIRPRWTPVAESEIASEQFNDLSAVFPYDDNGHPLYLRMAAITNDPALLEIKSLVALAAEFFTTHTKETSMNELLGMILQSLSVISSDDEVNITDENAKDYVDKAIEAITNLKIAAEAAVEIKEVIESEKKDDVIAEQAQKVVDSNSDEIAEAEKVISEAELSGVDLSKYVPVTVYQSALEKLAALSSDHQQLSATQIINNARRNGLILASEVAYYQGIARQKGVAVLDSMIKGRKPLAALTSRQTHSVTAKQNTSFSTLTASDLQVIEATGISKSDYLKTKRGMNNGN